MDKHQEFERVQILDLDWPIHGRTVLVSDLFLTGAGPCVAFFTWQYVGMLIFEMEELDGVSTRVVSINILVPSPLSVGAQSPSQVPGRVVKTTSKATARRSLLYFHFLLGT